MTISKSTRSNLDRIAGGQTSYQQGLTELRESMKNPSATFCDSSHESGDGKRLNILAKIRRY